MSRHPGEPTFEADQLLAERCSEGDLAAIAELEAAHFRSVLQVMRGSDTAALRAIFLSAPKGQRPTIAAYSGEVSLRTWLKVTALRAVAHHTEPSTNESWLKIVDDSASPELSALKKRSYVEFTEAFRAAVKQLSASERTVLRLRFSKRLEIEQISNLYSMHRVSVARWLATAREHLALAARDELISRLKLQGDALKDLLFLVRLQLDLSLRETTGRVQS